MSNYQAKALNPRTGQIEWAQFLDDYFGKHRYGLRFNDGTHVYSDRQVVCFVQHYGWWECFYRQREGRFEEFDEQPFFQGGFYVYRKDSPIGFFGNTLKECLMNFKLSVDKWIREN